MNPKTLERIGMIRGHLLRSLEIMNQIDFEDWLVIVHSIRKQKDRTKLLTDNAERGGLFCLVFFLAETLQFILENKESS